MIKKIILLGAILLPFLIYYISAYITKRDSNKKFPIIILSLISLILLASVLIFFRFTDKDPSDGIYIPPKFKNGKIISPKTK
ncbi:MAG: hypothetical protein CMI85_06100 [Candidatus Pelagibacter sp.]|nr:hypothetical protein [Candidatus Pelagibacter sp.]|tara:strand:- start:569 stop:814 length:246 start_codon:yes stop_codon:yes gene_type:complete